MLKNIYAMWDEWMVDNAWRGQREAIMAFARHYAKVSTEELQKDLDANVRDWKMVAYELGCKDTREDMLRKIRELKIFVDNR